MDNEREKGRMAGRFRKVGPTTMTSRVRPLGSAGGGILIEVYIKEHEMAFDLARALDLHPAALKLRAERTKVIASNLANVDTPGYQARDLDFGQSLAEAGAGASAPTRLGAPLSGGPTLGYRVPYQAAQDGNTVELGVEQAAFAQNAVDFQTSLTFLNMKIRGLQSAITGNT
jgi:flagellar basal-body rod protein FlgB